MAPKSARRFGATAPKPQGSLEVQGFGVLGFWGLACRVLGFWVLEIRVLGFRI